jgi:hypothetical protein
MLRRRAKHQFTLQDRIVAWAKEVRKQAAELPPGPDQDMLLKKVRQAAATASRASWPNPPSAAPLRVGPNLKSCHV